MNQNSDCPEDDQHPIADAYLDSLTSQLKHMPNSWAMPKVTASEPPFEPHCQALISTPPPIKPWELNWMDKRLLQALKIKPE